MIDVFHRIIKGHVGTLITLIVQRRDHYLTFLLLYFFFLFIFYCVLVAIEYAAHVDIHEFQTSVFLHRNLGNAPHHNIFFQDIFHYFLCSKFEWVFKLRCVDSVVLFKKRVVEGLLAPEKVLNRLLIVGQLIKIKTALQEFLVVLCKVIFLYLSIDLVL